MWSLFRLFDDDCIVNVLDIGASIGDVAPYQRLVDSGRARVTGFEPNAAECEKLCAAYGPSHRFLPLFLGDGREATFFETNNAYTGSLFEPNMPLLDKFWELGSMVRPVAEHRIATTRLDDVDGLGEVDIIKLDVQGAELDILANASVALGQTLAIQVEVNFLEQYKKQPMFSDVDAFLRAKGFQFHRIIGSGARPFLPLVNPKRRIREFNQQIWADALYVTDWMHLERLSTEKLKRFAGFLHDAHGSFDLAHLALVELDRRTGEALAAEYRRRLERDGAAVSASALDDSSPSHRSAPPGTAPGPKEQPIVEAAVPIRGASKSLTLETDGGLVVSAPATLRCITTYVLLEQERWFEKEVDFVARYLMEGMIAVDIGANLGLYSLPMAKAVGSAGRVYAYEPGADSCRHLEESIALNAMANLQIMPMALSDSDRSGWLRLGQSGELNSIADSAAMGAERVAISSLDSQSQRLAWQSVDFIKIDAEGQEARIVAGGKDFFRRFSPVVMYEVAHGESTVEGLRWMFEALGYGTYRLLGDGSCLVPVGGDEKVQEFELNLFAIKADRAGELAARGLLARGLQSFSLPGDERAALQERLCLQPYAQAFGITPADIDACPFADGLTSYAASRFADDPNPERKFSALAHAFSRMERHCAENPSPAALSTLARIAADIGFRAVALSALGKIAAAGDVGIDQPFVPAAARFDLIRPEGNEAQWFMAAALEQIELLVTYSSFFHEDISRLRWLCAQPWASAALLRRVILVGDARGVPRKDIATWLGTLQGEQLRNAGVWRQDIGQLTEMLGT